MGLLVVSLLMALVAAPQQSVTGKWDGKISFQREDGTKGDDTALLILEQKDKAVTGTLGGNEGDQHPITSGTIDGNKITLLAKHSTNGREYKLELTVDNDTLNGILTSGPRQAEFEAKRRKE